MDSRDEDTNLPHTSPFEAIRKKAEDGSEYWNARELARILGYTEYGKFKNAIKKAEIACESSGQATPDPFAHVGDMIQTGKGARRNFREDISLGTSQRFRLRKISTGSYGSAA